MPQKEKKPSPFTYVEVTEQKRLNEAREVGIPWKKWGPYLSERQWGTVREDYSTDGNAWDYFTHDQSRSRAYRWGEDGMAGILRRQAAALFRPGAVEWPRSDSEGAHVRPHQQRSATTAKTSRNTTFISTVLRRTRT